MLGIIHLADTREQAIEDCTYGLQDFANYFGAAGFVPLSEKTEDTGTAYEFVENYAAKGNCCIGTPADAIAYIQDLLDRSGGFGTFLLLGHDWAPPAATFHSYELFAREVIPHFKGQLTAAQASHEWAKGMRDQLLGRAGQAIVNAITEATRTPPDPPRARVDARRGPARRPDGGPRRRTRTGAGPGPGARRGEGLRNLWLRTCISPPMALTCWPPSADLEGVPDMDIDMAGDVFMGHEFSAEILDAGPDTEAPAAGTLVTSVPVLISAGGVAPIVYSNTTLGGYAEKMLLSAPLLLPVPNGLSAERAALTEPMAVGPARGQRVAHRTRRDGTRRRLRPGRYRHHRRTEASGRGNHCGIGLLPSTA